MKSVDRARAPRECTRTAHAYAKAVTVAAPNRSVDIGSYISIVRPSLPGSHGMGPLGHNDKDDIPEERPHDGATTQWSRTLFRRRACSVLFGFIFNFPASSMGHCTRRDWREAGSAMMRRNKVPRHRRGTSEGAKPLHGLNRTFRVPHPFHVFMVIWC